MLQVEYIPGKPLVGEFGQPLDVVPTVEIPKRTVWQWLWYWAGRLFLRRWRTWWIIQQWGRFDHDRDRWVHPRWYRWFVDEFLRPAWMHPGESWWRFHRGRWVLADRLLVWVMWKTTHFYNCPNCMCDQYGDSYSILETVGSGVDHCGENWAICWVRCPRCGAVYLDEE